MKRDVGTGRGGLQSIRHKLATRIEILHTPSSSTHSATSPSLKGREADDTSPIPSSTDSQLSTVYFSSHTSTLTGFLRVVISSSRDFLNVKRFPCKRCVSTRARTGLFRLANPRFLGAWHDYFHIPSWLHVKHKRLHACRVH